ncbi:hypothetical protein [Vulcanisaeta distributa]|uniref:hypothetical protein n=1 Tax=Vulcanisaeta distributa TaxID=164451 RepID=UPI0006D1A12A|nr:hypothetical protein [Vulcanisaeta distributa]
MIESKYDELAQALNALGIDVPGVVLNEVRRVRDDLRVAREKLEDAAQSMSFLCGYEELARSIQSMLGSVT